MSVIEEFYNDEIEISHSINDFPINEDFFMHIHDLYEILCFVSGEADFIVEGNSYKMKSGCIVIARASESHKINIKGTEAYERYVINFSPEYLLRCGFSPEIFKAFEDRKIGEKNVYFPDELEGIYPIEFFRKFFYDSKHNNWEDVYKARIATLLCSINSAFYNKSSISGNRYTHNKLIDYVNKNLFGDVSLEKISCDLHLSISQVNRNFKDLTGSTVHNYVISKRLIAAQKMISEGKSANEACQLSGFNDYSSFFRIYKKRFGVSPTAAK